MRSRPLQSTRPTARVAACSILLAGGGVAPQAAAEISFDPPQVLTLPDNHLPTRVLPIDLDGDEVLDLIIPGRGIEGFVERFRGLEDGTFQPLPAIELGLPTDDVVAGDLDGDGDPDLVFAARSANGRLVILQNLGDHTFAEPVEVRVEREPRGLAIADLDDDGDLDAIAVNYGSDSISTLLGDGKGMLVPAEVRTFGRETVAICYPQEVFAEDLDADGRLEAVASAIGNGRVQRMTVDGAGLFIGNARGTISPIFGEQQSAITTLSIHDLDGDGDLDVVTPVILLGLPQAVVAFINDGAGGLDQRVQFDTVLSGFSWCSTVADFTGDGRPEIATGLAIPGTIVVLENLTESADEIFFAPGTAIYEGSFIRDLSVGDVDRDGHLDLLAVDIASDKVLVFRSRAGDGGLAGDAGSSKSSAEGPRPVIGPLRTGSMPRPVADLNRDGRVDARDLAIELGNYGIHSLSRSTLDADGEVRR